MVETNEAGNAEYGESMSAGSGLVSVANDAPKLSTEYDDVRKQILVSLKGLEDKSWDVSVLLEKVYERGLYTAWGYSSFEQYVNEEMGIQMRKAQYLVNIQKWSKLMPDSVKAWIREIGWTKARLLTSIVTVENASEWKAKIAGKTVIEIVDLIKGERQRLEAEEGEDGEGGNETTEEKPRNLNFKVFPAQEENIKRALEHAEGPAKSDKPGNLIDLICTEYMATNVGINTVGDYLRRYEKLSGLRIVAYDMEDSHIVYGEDFIVDIENSEDPK